MKTLFALGFVLGLNAIVPLYAATSPATGNVYLRSSVAAPWNADNNEHDMDDVFGAGSWDDMRYETVDPSALFSSDTTFIFMEGGDNNANALQVFLDNNAQSIAAWVNGGGRLFVNAAPNQGNGMSFGFGVTLNFDPDNYTSKSTGGAAIDSRHPIFHKPMTNVGTTFSAGDSFSHAYLTGSGISPIIQDDQGRTVLAESQVGRGLVLFGGMTLDVFQSPWPQTHNLRLNVIAYTYTRELRQD